MPLEKLGTGRSEIRNPPIFKDLKLIEAWGSGIWKIKQELLRYSEIELILKEVGYAFQVQFIKKTLTGKAGSGQSQGRVRAESGQSRKTIKAENLRSKIIRVLSSAQLSKSEICTKLGLKRATGQLNREVRCLVDEGIISYTIPEKPNSRLQKYKLNKQKG